MITPIEIRQQTFPKRFRGYEPEEVNAFLQGLSQEWEDLREENRKLKEELERTRANYHALKEVEDMLHKTLMQAERSSRDTLETARQKAELKIQEADSQSAEIIRRALKNREEIQSEIGELYRQREDIITQLEVYLKTQLDRLNGFRPKESLNPRTALLPVQDLTPAPPATPNPTPETKAPEKPLFPENAQTANGHVSNGSATSKHLLEDFSDEL